jgi:branched-chain amino acid transport system substrate-binding protein
VNPITGTVTTVDSASMRVIRSLHIDGEPRSLAADGNTMWVAVTRPAGTVSADVAGVKPLPASRCQPVLSGNGGRADVLIVSDLPLQGDTRLSAVQMAQAITFVLREHRFRAGRHRIAYQSCDDALATTGLYDDIKCAANARAYAKDQDVVGVIGTFNSGCAIPMLPELNRAPGGPLGMVSPLNSYVGLTREGEIPGMLASLYPTGKRNFVRIYPADDIQSGALARLARDRGRRRVFVIEDENPGYSGLIATGFATAAGRLGLDVVGRATLKLGTRSFARLAGRVARTRAQAVFVSALASDDTGRLIRTLRRTLGRDVDLMGPDGLSPPAVLQRTVGAAARGIFVGYSGLVTEALPPAGARFVERFARTQGGEVVESYAVYAAQATEVMLDAIRRSDGTRGSVLDEMFRTRLQGGLLGDIAFDARGDVQPAVVTVLRVVGGSSATSIASAEGAAIERVERVDPALVAGG